MKQYNKMFKLNLLKLFKIIYLITNNSEIDYVLKERLLYSNFIIILNTNTKVIEWLFRFV